MADRFAVGAINHRGENISGTMVPYPTGNYIRYSDYAALAAELETVKGELSRQEHRKREVEAAGLPSEAQWLLEAKDKWQQRALAAEAKLAGEEATHRHKKRGTEYVLIGIGRMQAEHWYLPGAMEAGPSVDMQEVAVYRSVDDGSLWVRPREEFEDGRFEALTHPAPTHNDGSGEKAERLGRFNHHPDPAIDFEIEVQSLEARLFDAKGGISKPGTKPETVASVLKDIERAMEFIVGGDPITVAAKAALRDMEKDARTTLSHASGEVTDAASFLADRLDDFSNGLDPDDFASVTRGWIGYVVPALARLRAALRGDAL